MKTKKITSVVIALLVAISSIILPLNMVETSATVSATATRENPVKMPDNVFELSSSSDMFKVVTSTEKGGFYYYNSYNNRCISFYSVKDNTVRKIIDYTDKAVLSVYATKAKFYILERDSTDTGKNIQYYIDTFNTETEKLESQQNINKFINNDITSSPVSVGADSQGRIYLCSYDGTKDENNYVLTLLSPDYKELSSIEMKYTIVDFYGFDSNNGNVYFESYRSQKSSWGLTQGFRVLCYGNVTNNKISIRQEYIDVFYYENYQYHYGSAGMINDNTLAYVNSQYTDGTTATIMDSSKIDMATTSAPILLSVNRDSNEASDNWYDSVGTRIVYNNANNSTVMCVNDTTLNEFDSDYKKVSSLKTQYPVFTLLNYGDNILVIEKDTDGNFYTENFYWSMPSKITVSPTSKTIKVGENFSTSATDDALPTYSYKWSSSDSKVASVTSDGTVYGNKEGTAVITAQVSNGTNAKCTVTVENNSSAKGHKVTLSGATSTNISENDYTRWSSVMTSYLSENDDGTINRVESTSNGVLIEQYSQDGKKLISKKTIDNELELFGGYFLGKDNNYLVFGKSNKAENDKAEVVRVVKYTKDWSKVSDCKIYGSNTTVPFDAGSLRMMELDGKLYVYTCHEMYADENKLNHQANMLFTIDESTMKTVDSMYEVSNLMNGYVSHSFNQFIKTDGDYIYRVDHSESNNFTMGGQYLSVNGITLTRYNKNDKSTSVAVTVPVLFDVNNYNYTGAAIGGFELGSGNCIIAFTKDISTTNRNRNAYLTVTDTLFNSTKKVALTSYKDGSKVTCGTPELVKVSENLFLVMWEEKNTSTNKATTKAITVDANGKTISAKTQLPARLSDCQPILCSDGLVKWYVTDNSKPTLYCINPYSLADLHEHEYTSAITKEPTCTENGIRTYTCKICGETKTEVVKASHSYITTTTSATMKNDGRKISKCSVCGDVQYSNVINKIATVAISKTTFTYNGKTQTPTVTVKDSKGKALKNNTDYTVTYSSGRKNVGRYTVKVKFKGDYSGEKTFYYNINPKSTSIKSVKGLSKSIQVNLNLQKTQTTGYQVQYSLNKNFKNSKTVTLKNTVSSKKITKLSGKKKYYVRVRTYKTTKFSGKNYNLYSSWSSAKTVTTKK